LRELSGWDCHLLVCYTSLHTTIYLYFQQLAGCRPRPTEVLLCSFILDLNSHNLHRYLSQNPATIMGNDPHGQRSDCEHDLKQGDVSGHHPECPFQLLLPVRFAPPILIPQPPAMSISIGTPSVALVARKKICSGVKLSKKRRYKMSALLWALQAIRYRPWAVASNLPLSFPRHPQNNYSVVTHGLQISCCCSWDWALCVSSGLCL
jgi:hypothetical protein